MVDHRAEERERAVAVVGDLDEARLLRNDIGQPLEVVGLWLDVSEATEAADRVRQSEERYRVLVEDSPAMICRYRPDLALVFGNRPLADYLHCAPEQLEGMNLGQWLSQEQREAFLARLQLLTPEQPMSSAEIRATRTSSRSEAVPRLITLA